MGPFARHGVPELGLGTLAAGRELKDKVATGGELRREVQEIIQALDDEGRWISTYAGEPLYGQPKFKRGEKYLNSAVFSRNLETLSRF